MPLRDVTGELQPSGTHKPAPLPDAGLQEHVAAEDVIAGMIEKERQLGPDGNNDLLDPQRPVE